MDIRGTKSEKNVIDAFSNESQAINRYHYFAKKAGEEGLADIAKLFLRMAENEQEHARIWYKILNGELGDTVSNLKHASKSENGEWKTVYPQYAKEAREEGFETLAAMFDRIAAIEYDHERQFDEAVLKLTLERTDEIDGTHDKQNMATDISSAAKYGSSVTLVGESEGVEPRESSVKKYCCMFCGHRENTWVESCCVCGAKNSLVE